MSRKKQRCEDFEAMWKIDSTGSLKCVCGLKQDGTDLHPNAKEPDVLPRVQVHPVRNEAALTDDHPAGKTDTSIAAFESTNRPKGLKQVERLIRAAADGLTAEQAADSMGVGQATTSARFNDLRRAGVIERHVRRSTHSGRGAWAHKIVAGM